MDYIILYIFTILLVPIILYVRHKYPHTPNRPNVSTGSHTPRCEAPIQETPQRIVLNGISVGDRYVWINSSDGQRIPITINGITDGVYQIRFENEIPTHQLPYNTFRHALNIGRIVNFPMVDKVDIKPVKQSFTHKFV